MPGIGSIICGTFQKMEKTNTFFGSVKPMHRVVSVKDLYIMFPVDFNCFLNPNPVFIVLEVGLGDP